MAKSRWPNHSFTLEGAFLVYRMEDRELKIPLSSIVEIKEWKRKPTGRPIVWIGYAPRYRGDVGHGVELLGTKAEVETILAGSRDDKHKPTEEQSKCQEIQITGSSGTKTGSKRNTSA